jgi:hypothetical protein
MYQACGVAKMGEVHKNTLVAVLQGVYEQTDAVHEEKAAHEQEEDHIDDLSSYNISTTLSYT